MSPSTTHLVYPETQSAAGPCDNRSSTVSTLEEPPHPGFAATIAPTWHSFAVVLFADIVGFTALASKLDPTSLVYFLDQFFGEVDEYCQQLAVEV